MKETGAFLIIVDDTAAGKRLDSVVGAHVSDCSRSRASQLIANGKIRVNDIVKKSGYRVKTGDRISGSLPLPEPMVFVPEPMDIDAIYEDEHILVINKAAGRVVHPAPGNFTGTLVNGLLYHFPELRGAGRGQRPGIVHRLDKDTSGTLVIAKTTKALEKLALQFRLRSVRKEYRALVYGDLRPDAGEISFPIGRHPVDRKKMSVRSRKGRRAETTWQVLERFAEATLLQLHIKTGRTHQIRIHCKAIGHPVVGDAVYGGRRTRLKHIRDHNIKSILSRAERQMLHAEKLELNHPVSGERMTFISPMPTDMIRMLEDLREFLNHSFECKKGQ